MTIGALYPEYDGKSTYDYEMGTPLRDPATATPRLRIDYESETSVVAMLTELLSDPAVDRLEGLIIGAWVGDDVEQSSARIVETLVAAADQLASLRALFLGEMTYEDCEISWIVQSDVSPLWTAFPKLRRFDVRGSNELSLGRFEHELLETFVLESGGTPKTILTELTDARLPSLSHLELYLGSDGYGWDATPDDVQKLLDSVNDRCPKLRYLGLRDSETIDELVPLIVEHPLLERIEELDLSLGTLSDVGAAPLADSERIRSLKKLDLHHHFISPEVSARLEALPIEVDLSDGSPDAGEDDRYVSVAE